MSVSFSSRILPNGGVAATVLRRHVPPEWRVEPATFDVTAIEFPHSIT